MAHDITPFEVLLTRDQNLALSHMQLGDAIVAMRAGWTNLAREGLTRSNELLAVADYDPVEALPRVL